MADDLDQWLYFLRHGDQLDPDALPHALDTPAIHYAMEELKMLTQNDLERERYEARLKAQRDATTLRNLAERELQKALKDGHAQGLAEGRTEGRTEGRAEGRAEGRLVGELIGRIQLTQQVLKRPVTPADDLWALGREQLSRIAADLEKELSAQP